jgi:chromosome partitioning protein
VRSVISVVQRKGGVGKTTIAISLAGDLHRRGRKVDLIDADPQRSAAEWAAPGLLPFRVAELPLRIGGAAQWAKLVRSQPGSVTIIDTAPHEYAVGAAVAIADVVVLPCTPSGLDLNATEQTISVVSFARNKRGTNVPVFLVPNRVDARTLEGQQILDALGDMGEVVCNPIASRLIYVRAFATGALPEGQAVTADLADLSELVLQAISVS